MWFLPLDAERAVCDMTCIRILLCESKQCKPEVFPHTRSLIDESRADLMTWLGNRIDHYTMTTYHALHPAVLRNPPALRARGVVRQRTEVQPEAMWDLMQKAKKARTNMEQAINLKSDEAAFIV